MDFSAYQENETIKKLLLSKEYVAIIPHGSPDGDAVGSAIALKLFIHTFHSNAEIVCVDPAPIYTNFLPEHKNFTTNLDLNIYKILCFVDCGGKNMSKFDKQYKDLFTRQDITIINIDHHPSNEFFGHHNIVDTKAASATQILFNLFQMWDFKITPDIANALLTGLHFDTGSFKHPNTTLEVLKAASQLTQLKGNNDLIAKKMFHTNKANQLKLWGKVLANSKITASDILTSAITQTDLKKFQASNKDLEGAIDYLNAVPNQKFSLLLYEDSNNVLKASLRTQSTQYDLSRIAQIFKGGGHKMAAGFRIEGKLNEEKVWKIS